MTGGTLISGDVNGDRVADFAILLDDRLALQADSFLGTNGNHSIYSDLLSTLAAESEPFPDSQHIGVCCALHMAQRPTASRTVMQAPKNAPITVSSRKLHLGREVEK